MKIVVAIDSFKGSLSADEACRTVGAAIGALRPRARIVLKPMADGGEGTARAMMEALGGQWVDAEVTSPLPGRQVRAGYVWFPQDRTALVEMASASGLTLLRPEELNPWYTTTKGTGELLRAAADRGARKMWLALGGSATVEGGVGAAEALGWQFLDRTGQPVPAGGEGLEQIEHILPPARGDLIPLEALTDVTNPLLGPQGAARIFGPQKGATPAMVEKLESGLRHLAEVVRRDIGQDLASIAGAGAAGGFGFGAMAFLRGTLVSGIDTLMDVSRLDEALEGADWVITGEGSFDQQSLQGKVVSGVLRKARQAGVPVVILAGRVQLSDAQLKAAGIFAAFPCQLNGMSLDYAVVHGRELLYKAASLFARVWLSDRK